MSWCCYGSHCKVHWPRLKHWSAPWLNDGAGYYQAGGTSRPLDMEGFYRINVKFEEAPLQVQV